MRLSTLATTPLVILSGVTLGSPVATTDGISTTSISLAGPHGALAELAEFSPASSSVELFESRQNRVDKFRMTIVHSSPFIIAASNQCPNAFSGDPSAITTCCISAAAIVIIAFIDAFAKNGDQAAQNGAQPGRRATLPYMDHDLSEDHYITTSYLDGREDGNGDYWNQTLIEMVHKATSKSSFVTYAHHTEKDWHMLSAAMDHGKLDTRAPDPNSFYAYYAWSDENRSVFSGRSTSKQEKNEATDSLYNYLHNNNVAKICANFYVNGQQANLGQFAITNKDFTPDTSECS